LEQQWSPSGTVRILQVSKGFSYRWDAGRPLGDRVVADSLRLDSAALLPAATYRVAVPDFLAGGGDGMTVLLQGRNRSVGKDLLAAVAHDLAAHSPYAPAIAGRIGRAN
jgi:5'-nucleotidase